MFCDWTIIKIWQRNYIYLMGIYSLHFLKIHLTAFVDLDFWCGFEKMTLHFDMFSMKVSSHVRWPPLGAKKCKNMAVTGVSHASLLIELGPICISIAASLIFKSCEDHSLLRSYNGGLWKTFTGLSPMPSVFLWDKAKQCRPRSDQNEDSDQGLHCLLTECYIKVLINMKNTT